MEISIIQKKSSLKKLNEWTLDRHEDSKSDRRFNSIRYEHKALLQNQLNKFEINQDNANESKRAYGIEHLGLGSRKKVKF